MNLGEFLYYVNWFLRAILIFLAFYLLYVIVVYVNGIVGMINPTEKVVQECNSFVEMGDDFGYCCKQFNVYVNEQVVGSSCYGLRQHGLIKGVLEYECGGVNCGT